MIILRNVFQASFGKGGEFARHLAEHQPQVIAELGQTRRWRVLTDLGGPFDTVVLEVEAESLAEWERIRPQLFQSATFQAAMAQARDLLVGGPQRVLDGRGGGVAAASADAGAPVSDDRWFQTDHHPPLVLGRGVVHEECQCGQVAHRACHDPHHGLRDVIPA